MELCIALVQMDIAPSDPRTNLERMGEYIRQAKKQGADLVVFPEDAVNGPLGGQTEFVATAAQTLAHFQALAVKHCVDLVPGTWTIVENGMLFNAAHYINADGTVAGVYRKVNLWETEKAAITPGASVSVFPTRFGLVGLIVCWDISFPAMFAEMVAQGVELVIAPTYWSFTKKGDELDEVVDEEILLIDGLCVTRAFENNVVFAYCNAAGELNAQRQHAVLSGRSQVTHPLEKVVCKAEGNEETMLLARVKLERPPAPPPAPPAPAV